MEKKNTGLIILVIVLSIAVLGLGGFVVYDKILNCDSKNNNNNEINKEENNNVVEYIETFISSDYIKPILYSLSNGSKKIDENIIVGTLYYMFSGFGTSNNYFEDLNVRNIDLSPYIIYENDTEENIKEYHNFTISYISEQNLNEITMKIFNYDFNKIKQKFIKQMKNDPFDVFGEYNDGYIFAVKGMGGPAFYYEFVSNKFINDSKIYNYDIYCSMPKTGSFEELEETKIGEVEVTSKYNEDLKSFIFTEYNYKIDESIDTNNCFAP